MYVPLEEWFTCCDIYFEAMLNVCKLEDAQVGKLEEKCVITCGNF
jgi:hypothetical protein